MTADRLFDLLGILMVAIVGTGGLARTVALAARGVWVLPIDRQRRPLEGLLDLAFLLGLITWVYQAIATTVAPEGRMGSGAPSEIATAWLVVRSAGLLAAVIGVGLYVKALRDLGASWRFTIDRQRAGPLVTTGVFARTRNPIYLALSLVLIGVSLALGSVALALLACAAPCYFQQLIAREERFLAALYGESYESYCRSVPRWLRWSPPKADDEHG